MFVLVYTKLNPAKQNPKPAVLGSVVNELPVSGIPEDTMLNPDKLFDLVNEYRKENNLETLEKYEPLCEYAKTRSIEIKENWSHDKFYQDVEDNKLSGFCPDCYRAGENLAHFYPTEEEILAAWIASSTHKDNLKDDWNWACVAISDNTYTALVFGKEK